MYLTPRTYASLAPSTMPACSSFPHRSPVIHAILHIGPHCGGVLAHSYVPAGMRACWHVMCTCLRVRVVNEGLDTREGDGLHGHGLGCKVCFSLATPKAVGVRDTMDS